MKGKSMGSGRETQKYIWEGAIPLQIHLHESEITTLPSPPPVLILAPRIGYLPLLVPLIKPQFSSTLPPGVDTVWFEYKGLPLKWYIPTGVLFDLLCAEPERPWNLTSYVTLCCSILTTSNDVLNFKVHFRGFPGNVLVPCEGEESVKWSFINSLKEAAYIINGNCKNVMNMSQPDQMELWHSVLNGNMDAYLRISSKLKLGTVTDDYMVKSNASALHSQQSSSDMDGMGPVKTGRIPVRLYVWSVSEDFVDLEDAPPVDGWDKILYINRPVEIHKEEGKCFTLGDAVRSLLPELFTDIPSITEEISRIESEDEQRSGLGDEGSTKSTEVNTETLDGGVNSGSASSCPEIKLIRIQGIEPKMEIPFSWVVNNLKNPEHFLHICVCVRVLQPVAI
ncbi:Autophagy-related protein 5 [Dillenia turbinata]|uniref:Autophagy protein 5 n=1 Tax=Dillenia turbinata TaxID=194707 RepID=A0AAN8Z742_9MAGN